MSRSRNLPELPKFVFDDVEKLAELYIREEMSQANHLARYAQQKAKELFDAVDEQKPFYILLMVVQVHERAQKHICQFAVVKNAKNDGSRIPNSLVWYCDKPKKIFKLAKDLSDFTPLKHWGDKTLSSASTKTLELSQ